MKLREIVKMDIEQGDIVSPILKELYEDNLSVDLESDDLETVLDQEITTEMIAEIKTLISAKPDEWNHFDIMRILGY